MAPNIRRAAIRNFMPPSCRKAPPCAIAACTWITLDPAKAQILNPRMSMMRRLACLSIMLMLPLAHADEIKLPNPLRADNTTYQGTLYQTHDAAYLTFYHESGVAHVPISSLPKDVQALLGYDAQAAAAQIEAEDRQRAARAAANATPVVKPIVIHGKLLQNTEKGLLISTRRDTGRTRHTTQWSGDNTRMEEADQTIYETVLYLVRGNQNADVLKPGIDVDYAVIPTGADFFKGNEAIAANFVKSLE